MRSPKHRRTRGHPPEVIEKLNREVNAALGDSRFRERLDDLGAEPFAISPDEFGELTVEYTQKRAKVIRAANIRVSL